MDNKRSVADTFGGGKLDVSFDFFVAWWINGINHTLFLMVANIE